MSVLRSTRWPSVSRAGAVALVLGGLPGAVVPTEVGGTARQSTAAAPTPTLASDVQVELARHLPSRVDDIARAIEKDFDERRAHDLVTALEGTWRLAGNAAFDRAQQRVLDRLVSGGFTHVASRPRELTEPSTWFVGFPNTGHGWSHEVARLDLVSGDGTRAPLLSKEQHRLTLCINSFSTPPGGVTAELIDVGGASNAAALASFDVAGRIVLGDADAGVLFRIASARGALGVVSTSLAPYVSPTLASSREPVAPRHEWDILQWGTIPFDTTAKGFGFKATPRVAADLRARLRSGPVRVRAEVVSSFAERPNRMLVAEIPGARAPREHVVMVAHVQEPGANDNASGVASLQEMVVGLGRAVARGALSRPDRTLTFVWGDEMSASRQWLQWARAQSRTVRYMVALDMTGQDVSATGGSFLIEKAPDPSAQTDSPFDPHTPWGSSAIDADRVRGTLLNDLVLAVCARYGARERWVIRTNPYEGGSDHSVFLDAGVPALLAWHFPDRFYHSNLDRVDKTSAAEMRRVGVSVGTASYLLASATSQDTAALATLLSTAARARVALEVSRAVDAEPWRRWYREALSELAALPLEGPTPDVRRAIDGARRALEQPSAPIDRPR